MKPKAIVLIGPPASGKGTYGKILGMLPGFFHFSMGHALRSRTPKNDEERDLLESLFQLTSKGNLVPDEIALRMFDDTLAGLAGSGQFQPDTDRLILDGIPRTAGQARAIDERMDIIQVFEFLCADDEIYRRVRGRVLKEGRADDASMETVQTRLVVYRRELPGLQQAYAGRIIALDTGRAAHRVLHDLLGCL